MTDLEAEKNKTAMTVALMEGIDSMAPIFDSANGIRADLERRGWSPTRAEAAAGEWLLGAIRLIWRQQ